MKRLHSIVLALVLLFGGATSSTSADFVVYAAKAKVPVERVEVGMILDTVIARQLKQNDLVNLALGRPLDVKVDRKTEVLALAVEVGAADPRAKLVVFDPSESGAAQVTAVVATLATSDYESASVKGSPQGQGIATAAVQETALGDPSKNALHASTVFLTGFGKGEPGADQKLTLVARVAGRLSFTTTEGAETTPFDGFIVNGKASVAGKPIGSYSE